MNSDENSVENVVARRQRKRISDKVNKDSKRKLKAQVPGVSMRRMTGFLRDGVKIIDRTRKS